VRYNVAETYSGYLSIAEVNEMKNDLVPKSISQYVAVFRAASALVIPIGTQMRINVSRPLGTVILTFRTRQIDKGFEKPLPGDLWVDARGPAENIESAVSVFGGAIGSLASVISFSTNAAIGNLEPELVFNNTPSLKARDFLQSMIPDEPSIIHVGRQVNSEATLALVDAMEIHPEKKRVGRAMSQYSLALKHWRWGHEILAIAHLYIGMETLTKAAVRSRLACGISEEELACSLGVDPSSLRPCDSLSTAIEVAVRKRLLFQGDEQCYRDAKDASDGFEHGFMPFDEIRNRARVVRDNTAAYLRKAILDLVAVKAGYRDVLLADPYNVPLGNWPVVKYMRGQLLGDSDVLAAEGNEYPILSWRSTIKSVDISKLGEYVIKFDETFTARLGNGICFQPKAFEVWRP
jgi:hypothetical protein